MKIYKAKYLLIDSEKSEIYITDKLVSTNYAEISLEDVVLKIDDGVLYVTGTQHHFEFIDRPWDNDDYTLLSNVDEGKVHMDSVQVVEEYITIGNWFRRKKVKVVKPRTYIHLKHTNDYSYTINPFTIFGLHKAEEVHTGTLTG